MLRDDLDRAKGAGRQGEQGALCSLAACVAKPRGKRSAGGEGSL